MAQLSTILCHYGNWVQVSHLQSCDVWKKPIGSDCHWRTSKCCSSQHVSSSSTQSIILITFSKITGTCIFKITNMIVSGQSYWLCPPLPLLLDPGESRSLPASTSSVQGVVTPRTSRRCASWRSLPLGTHVCSAPVVSARRRCPLDGGVGHRPWSYKLPSTEPGGSRSRPAPSWGGTHSSWLENWDWFNSHPSENQGNMLLPSQTVDATTTSTPYSDATQVRKNY